MGFQVITGIYRTNENNGTYDSAVVITINAKTAYVEALTQKPSKKCVQEILTFLKSIDVTEVLYDRRNNNKERKKSVKLEKNDTH